MSDQDNLGANSPAAKKAEEEARKRAAKLDKDTTLKNLTPTLKKAANENRQPPP